MLEGQEEKDEYEENVKAIFKDLVYHTIKNQPKNIVRNLIFIFFILLAEIYG